MLMALWSCIYCSLLTSVSLVSFFITLLYFNTFSSHETAVGCIVLQLKLL